MKRLVFFVMALSMCLPAFGIADAPSFDELPDRLRDRIEDAKAFCAEVDDGTFTLDWGAVARVDLDGDRAPDWVLDEAGFACSSGASLYCGTGGCMSHFVIGDTMSTLLNRGWHIAALGDYPVLLAAVHTSQCAPQAPGPCVTASIWDKDARQWRSGAAEWMAD